MYQVLPPPEALGIDLGETILHTRETNGKRTKIDIPDAIRVIRRLCGERFTTRTYIISKVTPEQRIRAEAWLEENSFIGRTGIPWKNVHFCDERHEKAEICLSLGITHLIDDRPEVMSWASHVEHRILFKPIPEDLEFFKADLHGVHIVDSWLQIEMLLLPDRISSIRREG